MATAELSGIYPQKGAPAHRGQPVLVLPLCGFSSEASGGIGGWNLLLAGYTGRIKPNDRRPCCIVSVLKVVLER